MYRGATPGVGAGRPARAGAGYLPPSSRASRTSRTRARPPQCRSSCTKRSPFPATTRATPWVCRSWQFRQIRVALPRFIALRGGRTLGRDLLCTDGARLVAPIAAHMGENCGDLRIAQLRAEGGHGAVVLNAVDRERPLNPVQYDLNHGGIAAVDPVRTGQGRKHAGKSRARRLVASRTAGRENGGAVDRRGTTPCRLR